jgi:hypothetical protein
MFKGLNKSFALRASAPIERQLRRIVSSLSTMHPARDAIRLSRRCISPSAPRYYLWIAQRDVAIRYPVRMGKHEVRMM